MTYNDSDMPTHADTSLSPMKPVPTGGKMIPLITACGNLWRQLLIVPTGLDKRTNGFFSTEPGCSAEIPIRENTNGAAKDFVLIVDDNVAINKLFEYYIKSYFNSNIVNAFNGEDGVKMALEYNPAVILMDIHMPGKDGITATEELRSAGFDNPILIISAHGRSLWDRCIEAGADAVITKPVEKYGLIKLVEKHCSALV